MGFFANLFGRGKDPEPKRRRSFAGADTGRLFSDWVASNQSPDAEIYGSLTLLRARSRDLERGNAYIEQWLSQAEANIIGDGGIRTTPRPKMKSGKPDEKAAKIISEAWQEFGERGNFTADKLRSRAAWSRGMVRSVARDGDSLAEIIRGYGGNKYGFAVQAWEADYLNTDDNDADRGIRMGVRRGGYLEHIGYRVSNSIQKNNDLWGTYGIRPTDNLREIRAEMSAGPKVGSTGILAAMYTRFSQTRGVPWCAPVIGIIRQLQMYTEAEVVAARTAAAKLGFLFDATGRGEEGEEDYQGQTTISGAPGSITRFSASPDEIGFQSWDPNNPNGNYADFKKAMLREIAAGLKISYNVLGSDLEGVSFSSIRQGTMSERELWMVAQRWYIETIELPLYRAWLEWSMMKGILPFSWMDYDRLAHVEMEGRRWDYVNPLQDIQAAKMGIEIGVNSQQAENRKRGQTFDRISDEQQEDKEKAKKKGLTFADDVGETFEAEPRDGAEGDDLSADKFQTLKAKFDSYGVAVRAGALTPQVADEEQFRKEGNLPAMSGEVKKAWTEDKVRRPITIKTEGQMQSEEDILAAQAGSDGGDDDGSEEPEADDAD